MGSSDKNTLIAVVSLLLVLITCWSCYEMGHQVSSCFVGKMIHEKSYSYVIEL